jgi:hypothetical protein
MPTLAPRVRRIWDCRWSRPGYQLGGLPRARQLELVWLCDRPKERPRPVEEWDCRTASTGKRRPRRAAT